MEISLTEPSPKEMRHPTSQKSEPGSILLFSQIEKLTWVLALLVCLISGFLIHGIKWMSLVWGVFVAVGNLMFWRFLFNRFLQKLSNSAKENARSGLHFLVFLGQAKLLLIGGLVFILVRFWHMEVLFFLLGLSILPLAFLLWAGYRVGKILVGKGAP